MPLGTDISPDLARKALVADERNLLTGVAQGGTLPPSKRQMLLATVIQEAKPEEFTQARIYAILVRYTSGGRLTKDELSEIAHLLPQEHGSYSKTLTEGKYLKSYKAYETVYGKKERSIKWYVKQGKKAPGGPDLPPLDDAMQMPIWWDRVMTQSCPESIKNAATVAASAKPPAAVASTDPTPPPAAAAGRSSSSPTPHFVNPAVTSQEQDVQHLKEQLARARAEQLEAENEDPPDDAKIQRKRSIWRELRNEAEKAEESLYKLRSKQGKHVDQEQLGAQLLPKLVTVALSIRHMRTRIKPQLAAASSEDEEERIWQDAIDESFGELIANGFVTREQLSLAA